MSGSVSSAEIGMRFEVRQRLRICGKFAGYSHALRLARTIANETGRYTLIWDRSKTGNVVWTSNHGQIREIDG